MNTPHLSTQSLEDNEPESKQVHFRRRLDVFVLRHHANLCPRRALYMYGRGCDARQTSYHRTELLFYNSKKYRPLVNPVIFLVYFLSPSICF
jgi:hypothetical protein